MTTRDGLFVVSGDQGDDIGGQIIAELRSMRAELEKAKAKNGNGNGLTKRAEAIAGTLIAAAVIAATGAFLQVQLIKNDYVTELELETRVDEAEDALQSHADRGAHILADQRLDALERLHEGN